jgi:hypothetical protein
MGQSHTHSATGRLVIWLTDVGNFFDQFGMQPFGIFLGEHGMDFGTAKSLSSPGSFDAGGNLHDDVAFEFESFSSNE